MRSIINSYKYQDARGWSLIFGRLVVGWLEEHAQGNPPDLIVANPTYTGTDGREFGHTEFVLETAAREDVQRRWPFDLRNPRAIVKVHSTSKSASATAAAKRTAAAELRSVLQIPDPLRTEGRRILVYDDVCTTASQLNAVADCLLHEGHALDVQALVLARAPWRNRNP